MKLRRRRRSPQAGFTLVELMISLVLFSFAIAGVLAVAVAMAAGFREQKMNVGAESWSRAAMDFLADAIRGASPGVPAGKLINLDETTCVDEDALKITNSSSGPDELTVVFSYGAVVTSTLDPWTGGPTLDVADAAGLAKDDLVVVTNHITGHLAKIASVSGDEITFASAACTPAGFTYPAGAVVIRAAKARFYVADLDGVPTLWMDPDAGGALDAEPLAEGIEDLQVMIGIDSDGDGEVLENANGASDEWIHNAASETLPVGIPRALKLALVARTGKLPGAATFAPPSAGDHDRSTDPTDNFRRRVLDSVIEIRNLEGSK